MTTHTERRMERLASRLKTRTKRDGTPLPGYEQNVASIKAELAQLSVGQVSGDENDG